MACCSSREDIPGPQGGNEPGGREKSSDLSNDVQNLILSDEECRRSEDTAPGKENAGSLDSQLATSSGDEPIASSAEISSFSGSQEVRSPNESETPNKSLSETSENLSGNNDYQGITLADLPTEVFLLLCSYLDSQFLIRTLRLVCRRFNFILSDNFLWRSRILRSWTQLYPALPTQDSENINWRDECLHLEVQKKIWSNMAKTMETYAWKNTHFSCVDSIILINNGALCVSGSRDHSVAVWDVAGFSEAPIAHVDLHKGWVWRLTRDSESSFYSCSFDNSVKHLTLDPNLRETASFDCKTPVMSLASAQNFVAAAPQHQGIWLFDPRTDNDPVLRYTLSKGFAMSLGLICENQTPHLVVSGDTHGCVSIWDIRAGKMLKDSQKVNPKRSRPGLTILSMSIGKDCCYFGDSRGQLHLMDVRGNSETAYDIIATYDAHHRARSRIAAVCHGKGHLLTGGSDGVVCVCVPTHEPEVISKLQLDGELSCMDYKYNILALGCVGIYPGCVTVYKTNYSKLNRE